MSESGLITLDSRRYPFFDLSSGRSLLVDIDGQLPEASRKGIELNWPDYRVVAVDPDGDLRSLLSELFTESGFYSVVRNSPLSLGRGGTVRVTPDFLIVKDSRSLLEGTLYLVDVETPDSEGIPPFIREIALEHRIVVVEVGKGEEGEVSGGSGPGTRKITASDLPTLVAEVLSSVGLAVTPGPVTLPKVGGGGEGAGEEVSADLLVEGSGRSCLIFFSPPDALTAGLLDRDGAGYVDASGSPSPHDLFGRVFAELGIPHSGPSVEFFRPRGRYAFSLPGYYLAGPAGPLFLTSEEPEPGMAAFLASRGIEIVACLLSP